MHIVEDQQYGRLRRHRAQQPGHGIEQQQPFSFRIGVDDRGNVGNSAAELGNNAAHLATVLCHVLCKHFVRRAAHQSAQCLAPRPVWRIDVLVGAAQQHDGALVVRFAGQFGDQSRLADAWLAADQHDAPILLGRDCLPLLAQLIEGCVTARERQL